jgi:methylenetetrahydrofolate reductase (NADH)
MFQSSECQRGEHHNADAVLSNDRPSDSSTNSSGGRLEKLLRQGTFVISTELSPPDAADPDEVYARARVFDGYVDVINATDGSGANCHMSSIGVCALLEREGYEPVLQISCRDRNRIAIQGDILGASALGIHNLLCLSGDGVQAGDQPGAKPVFDLDSLSLLDIARTMRDKSQFASGRNLSKAPKLFLGGAANPFMPNYDFRVARLAKKIAAGAQFIQTQYCYDVARLESYMQRMRDQGLDDQVYLMVGVGPLASARAAQWIRSNVPGVHIPDAVIDRLSGADDQKQEGKNLCAEIIQQVKDIKGVSGVHVMAYRQEESVAEIIDRSGILQGRTPWSPKQKI